MYSGRLLLLNLWGYPWFGMTYDFSSGKHLLCMLERGNFILLSYLLVYKLQGSLNSRRGKSTLERALLGEALYHGPWAALLGMPRKQGLNGSLPGHFSGTCLQQGNTQGSVSWNKEHACFPCTVKAMVPQAVLPSCNAVLCWNPSRPTCYPLVGSQGVGVGQARVISLMWSPATAFVISNKVFCLIPRSLRSSLSIHIIF